MSALQQQPGAAGLQLAAKKAARQPAVILKQPERSDVEPVSAGGTRQSAAAPSPPLSQHLWEHATQMRPTS